VIIFPNNMIFHDRHIFFKICFYCWKYYKTKNDYDYDYDYDLFSIFYNEADARIDEDIFRL